MSRQQNKHLKEECINSDSLLLYDYYNSSCNANEAHQRPPSPYSPSTYGTTIINQSPIILQFIE